MQGKTKKQIEHWTKKEKNTYNLFVLIHEEEFLSCQQDSKKKRLFKKLSQWMNGHKEPEQCRNHHKKRLKGNEKSTQRLIDTIIREHYTQRFLPFEHFLKQTSHFLANVFDFGAINQEQKDILLMKARALVEKKQMEEQKVRVENQLFEGVNFWQSHSTLLK